MLSSSTSAWCFDIFHTSSIFHPIYQDINISTYGCREVLMKHQVSCKLTSSLGRSPYVSLLMGYLSHSCHASWIGLVARAMLEVGSLFQSPLNCLCTGQRLFWGLLKGRWISWVLIRKADDKVCPRVLLINWATGWRVTKSSMSWTALLCQLLILLYESSTQDWSVTTTFGFLQILAYGRRIPLAELFTKHWCSGCGYCETGCYSLHLW